MKDEYKTKEGLIAELVRLRQRIINLESSVSEHAHTEENLMNLNKQLQTLIDTSPVIICRSDLKTRVTYVNKKFEEVTGYTSEEVLGRSWVRLGMLSKDGVKLLIKRMLEKLKGKPPEPMEIKIKRKDGQYIWVTGVGEIIREQGKPVGFQIVAQDITERRRLQEGYRLIAENSADIIYKLKIKDEHFDYVSPSVERMLGYTEIEALSLQSKDVLTAESYEKQKYEMFKDIKSGIFMRTLELDAVHKDGHIIPIELHARIIHNENGEPTEIVGIVRDITERKKIQEQIITQERLASIGELTAGIAHEVSNPLTTVIGYTDLLLKQDTSDETKKDLEAIDRSAKRAANILDRLLAFAGQRSRERDYVDINHIIEIALEFRSHSLLSSNVEVIKQFDNNLPEIIADGGQLQDVFLNLIANAEYSMREGHGRGRLKITTKRTDGNIYISFDDDGAGISKENINKIFEPFFTTKPVGKGTGLGLSICRRIITEHDGRIYAESDFGRGATFIIELPIHKQW